MSDSTENPKFTESRILSNLETLDFGSTISITQQQSDCM